MDPLLPIISRSIMGDNGSCNYPLLTSRTCRCACREACRQHELSVHFVLFRSSVAAPASPSLSPTLLAWSSESRRAQAALRPGLFGLGTGRLWPVPCRSHSAWATDDSQSWAARPALVTPDFSLIILSVAFQRGFSDCLPVIRCSYR